MDTKIAQQEEAVRELQTRAAKAKGAEASEIDEQIRCLHVHLGDCPDLRQVFETLHQAAANKAQAEQIRQKAADEAAAKDATTAAAAVVTAAAAASTGEPAAETAMQVDSEASAEQLRQQILQLGKLLETKQTQETKPQ